MSNNNKYNITNPFSHYFRGDDFGKEKSSTEESSGNEPRDVALDPIKQIKYKAESEYERFLKKNSLFRSEEEVPKMGTKHSRQYTLISQGQPVYFSGSEEVSMEEVEMPEIAMSSESIFKDSPYKEKLNYCLEGLSGDSENWNFIIPGCESLGIRKWNNFSCGVRLGSNIERFYRNYGITKTMEVLTVLMENYNKWGAKFSNGSASFIIFSVTDKHEELVDMFYKLAHTASDFEINPNTGNRIIVFTLKLK